MLFTKIAYCGDDCSECPRYLATMSGNIEELRESAILMGKVGWPRDLENPDRMKCRGCEDIENCEYSVKECCIKQGLANCGMCGDYPCELINKAFEITAVNAKNFKTILSPDEYEIFKIAFFSKKKNLETINKLLKS